MTNPSREVVASVTNELRLDLEPECLRSPAAFKIWKGSSLPKKRLGFMSFGRGDANHSLGSFSEAIALSRNDPLVLR